MTAKTPERKMHLTDYLWVLKKRMLLILFFWGAVFAIVAVVTFTQRPTYKAEAMMLIEGSIFQPGLPGVSRIAQTQEFYNSQYQIMRSRRVAKQLYEDMNMADWEGFKRLPADRDRISIVRSWIQVSPVPKTHHVRISMVRGDQQQAARLVNQVTHIYRDIVEELKSKTLSNSISSLEKRSTEIQAELEANSRRIKRFTSERGIFAIPEIRNVVLIREQWLQEATAQANIDLITARSRYSMINKMVEEGKFEGMEDSRLLSDLREKRYTLVASKRASEHGLTPRHIREDRDATALDEIIEVIEQQVAAEEGRMQQVAVARITQELATTQANFDILSDMLLTNRDALNKISQDMLELEDIRSKGLNLEAVRDALEKAVQNIKTDNQYTETIARVESYAEIPKERYTPKYGLNLGLGLVVGLLVGIGAAFFFEYLNTTIRMPRDIEDGLGLPVLGFVPAMSSKLKDFPSRALIAHLDSRSGPAEAFRGIRTEVMLRSDLRQVKTGMVTSTSPQEGKTTVSVNWAITLAQAGNKVLLIDADLRKPMVHVAFNMNNDRGLSTLLAEKESATVYIKKTDIENLHVLPGGPMPDNPAELLGSRKMRTLIAEAAERYDSVIVDSSPVLGVADANILSTMVDCVVLVVQASKNRRGLVMRAKNQLASVNARLAGAILNNVRGTKGDYYYYRQYYRPVADIMEEESKLGT